MKTLTVKTKVIIFAEKYPDRLKIINDTIIEQVTHLQYLGYDIIYGNCNNYIHNS